jgi:hypothetical protein
VSEQDDQPEAKDPVAEAVEHAVEVLVYAPIGLLFEGASLLPQLIEKGKSQVAMARMVGQFAVTQGRGEAEKLAGRLQEQALGVLGQISDAVSVVPKSVPAPIAAVAKVATDTARPPASTAPDSEERLAGVAIDVATLAIPDYDGLSASHVVNRLAGLAPAELESVRLYELANRGRKTILSKVAQLQSS